VTRGEAATGPLPGVIGDDPTGARTRRSARSPRTACRWRRRPQPRFRGGPPAAPVAADVVTDLRRLGTGAERSTIAASCATGPVALPGVRAAAPRRRRRVGGTLRKGRLIAGPRTSALRFVGSLRGPALSARSGRRHGARGPKAGATPTRRTQSAKMTGHWSPSSGAHNHRNACKRSVLFLIYESAAPASGRPNVPLSYLSHGPFSLSPEGRGRRQGIP
jgi:hypothetical protein